MNQVTKIAIVILVGLAILVPSITYYPSETIGSITAILVGVIIVNLLKIAYNLITKR